MRTLLLLVSLLALSCANHGGFSLDKRDAPQRFCGSRLRLALQLVCNSNYKRSSPDSGSRYEEWIINVLGSDETHSGDPFHSYAEIDFVAPEYFRRPTRQGVADLCCHRPCTIKQMSEFCGSDPNI